jgi:murein DD-endopeptidase MepM/ murein hydrolase activator NlpD
MHVLSGTCGFPVMRLSVLRSSERRLAHGAAILLVGGLVSGCSSDAMRFTYDQDGMFTGATNNQRQMIAPEQPFPGDNPTTVAGVDGAHTGSINREAVKPVDLSTKSVTKTELAPVAGTKVAPADSKPLVKVSEPAGVDKTVTGTVAKTDATNEPAALESDPVGWSRAGGTQVTAKEGETIYNLSRRFGVPADVLMKMNGLSDANGLRAGQKIIIPTYVYNSKAPVSAPDSNPKVAGAKSSRGVKTDEPADKLPAGTPPADKVAVLPKTPKLKEGETAQPTESTADKTAEKVETKKLDTDKVAKTGSGAYTVQAGDTLSKIAKKNGVSVVALKQANGLNDGLLKIGQTLKLPAAGEKMAVAPAVDPIITGAAGPAKKAVDSGEIAGYTPPKKAEKTVEDADVDTASVAPDSTGIGKMRWPVRGRVVSSYGKGSGRSNDGIDIAVPEGTPVKAAENGVVIYAGDGLKDFGNTVLVRHENGLVTVYGHASELKVKRGEKVKRGQEIATSGMSGTTDAPKLHFEVRKDSAPVDPGTYLE